MTEFITRNHGNKDFEIIIKTNSREHYKATEDFVRQLIDHAKSMTTADRIRSMTDEELAQLLYCSDSLGWCTNDPACAAMLDEPDCIPEEKCIGCLLSWLRQPVGEGL